MTQEEQKPPPPQPGSDDWQFVERPIDLVRCTCLFRCRIRIYLFYLFIEREDRTRVHT